MADESKTALDTLYFVNDSEKNVTLEVIVGGVGQTSTMSVTLEDDLKVSALQGNLSPIVLGTNNALQGQVLTIACTITDTSRDTNFTELRIRINGGILFMEHPLFATVDEEGDSVNYVCIIRFFKP